ncbi:MAG: hypothetical protein CMJ18_01625 [Phycisphaeraceae bacterium]|nr:hypothetical protein [Phycisphaeraceae bacterium]
MKPSPRPRFRRFGHALHLLIRNADDLAAILELDEAHWVATSAPVSGIRADERFLGFVDHNADGRIRADELKTAIRWLMAQLRDTAGVDARSTSLRLDAVDAEQEDGRRITASARRMLQSLGATDTEHIELSQVRQLQTRVAATAVSTAGVVLPDAAEDATTRRLVEDVLAATGGAEHPGGRRGVGEAELNRFLAEAQRFVQWKQRGDEARRTGDQALLPLGEDTAGAQALLERIGPKLDQYYAQCRVVAVDADLAGRLLPKAAELDAVDFTSVPSIDRIVGEAPLAPPRADGRLDFAGDINPAWRNTIDELRHRVLEPLLSPAPEAMSESQWREVRGRFTAYVQWMTTRPPGAYDRLGVDRLAECSRPEVAAPLRELIARSRETALQLDAIELTEKLILYQAHLLELVNNFVSFPRLYDADSRALFEMGALVMDGRRFDMAIQVDQRAEHAKITTESDMFVIYAKVFDLDRKAPYEIASPVTSGGKGNVAIGKRGLFMDVDGMVWDAQVVQIIENPISIREAVVAPFKRIGRLISGKIEQVTGAAEKKLDLATQSAMTDGTAPAAAAPAKTFDARQGLLAGGVLAGGGLAIAAVGSALAYIGKVVDERGPEVLFGGVAAAVLAVLVPSIILAIIKLRRRDLSSVLEGSGWAINARMRLTYRQGRHFTRRPPYPPGARGVRTRLWWFVIVVLIVLAVVAWRVSKQWPTNPPPPGEAPAAAPADPPDPPEPPGND